MSNLGFVCIKVRNPLRGFGYGFGLSGFFLLLRPRFWTDFMQPFSRVEFRGCRGVFLLKSRRGRLRLSVKYPVKKNKSLLLIHFLERRFLNFTCFSSIHNTLVLNDFKCLRVVLFTEPYLTPMSSRRTGKFDGGNKWKRQFT